MFEMIVFYINLGFHNKNRDKFLHCAHHGNLVNKSFALAYVKYTSNEKFKVVILRYKFVSIVCLCAQLDRETTFVGYFPKL